MDEFDYNSIKQKIESNVFLEHNKNCVFINNKSHYS